MRKIYALLLLISSCYMAISQNVGVGTSTPDASAKLDISSTNQGLLIPRVSLSNVSTFGLSGGTSTAGMVVYNTNASITGGYGVGFYYWAGVWNKVATGNPLPAVLNNGQIWIGNASNAPIANTMSGDVTLSNTGVATVQDNSVDGTDISITAEANGDLMYYNGTDWVRLAAGTSGQILRTNGAAAPSWSDPNALFVFENGLTESAPNIVRLGGTLVQNTTIAQGGFTMDYTATSVDAFSVDGTTFSVDAANNRVGIGTAAPTEMLNVNGSTLIPNGASYWIGNNADAGDRLRLHHTGANAYIDYATGDLNFRSGTTTMATFGSNGNIGVNTGISNLYRFYTYNQQLTANGDGQATIYAYRTRDSQNDGTAYSQSASNSAVKGYNYWGDVYTFGVSGFCYNDYTRTGGVLGAQQGGSYWGSLGYKNSGSATYGGYFTSTATGGGYLPTSALSGIGSASYGGVIGAWTKGEVMGQVNSGQIFATYNIGDEYTSGKQVQLVETSGDNRIAAYSVTSPDIKVYDNGNESLNNGSTFVSFNAAFISLLGEKPTITVTPMGECNGLYISNISEQGFEVKELGSGSSNVAFLWIAVARRIDADKHTSVPNVLLSRDFDEKMNGVMFDENNLEQHAAPVWWDGQQIRFDEVPKRQTPKQEELAH